MAKRFNWQIDREQEYPYEAAKPKRQVAYVRYQQMHRMPNLHRCPHLSTSERARNHLLNNVETSLRRISARVG
jgi:hypothetical protein